MATCPQCPESWAELWEPFNKLWHPPAVEYDAAVKENRGGADSETPKRVKWGKEQLPRVAPVIPCVVVKRCIQGPHYLCRDHVVKGSGWQRKYFLFLMEHVKHTIGSEYVLIQPHSGTERHS